MEKEFEEKYRTLFRRHYAGLSFYAARLVGEDDAEDIVQDVFLRLVRSGERLSHVRSLGHYLLRCVDNGCRDYFRRRSCGLLPESAAGQEAEPEDRPMHEEYLRITALLSSIPEELPISHLRTDTLKTGLIQNSARITISIKKNGSLIRVCKQKR